MTVSYDLCEGMAQAVADYIEASQVAKLAAVDARYSTVIGLEAMTVRLGDVYQRREPLDVYPLLYVAPQRVVLEPVNAGLLRGAEAVSYFAFIVVAYVPDVDSGTPTERLKRQLMRYCVAVLEMLVESQNGTTRPWEWGTGGPTEVQFRSYPSDNAYIGLAAIQVPVQTVEVA